MCTLALQSIALKIQDDAESWTKAACSCTPQALLYYWLALVLLYSPLVVRSIVLTHQTLTEDCACLHFLEALTQLIAIPSDTHMLPLSNSTTSLILSLYSPKDYAWHSLLLSCCWCDVKGNSDVGARCCCILCFALVLNEAHNRISWKPPLFPIRVDAWATLSHHRKRFSPPTFAQSHHSHDAGLVT